jgi:hypothetical protein
MVTQHASREGDVQVCQAIRQSFLNAGRQPLSQLFSQSFGQSVWQRMQAGRLRQAEYNGAFFPFLFSTLIFDLLYLWNCIGMGLCEE